mgnify:CR=1 FL=1
MTQQLPYSTEKFLSGWPVPLQTLPASGSDNPQDVEEILVHRGARDAVLHDGAALGRIGNDIPRSSPTRQ